MLLSPLWAALPWIAFYRPSAAQATSSGTDAASTPTPAELANLEHYWSYGRSPPVYPSPQGNGLGDWAAAYDHARALVAQLTNEEKQNLTNGATGDNGCSGYIANISRIAFPGLCLQDSGNGVRGTDGTSGYPSGLHLGASWNRDLALSRAQYMGKEFKAKGVNVVFGPVAAPLGRVARGGRNWEGFSNDPYLSGSLIYESVQGLQESVVACTKHYIAYEQETNRLAPGSNPAAATVVNASVSSNLDDKTMHELYLWPFADAVRAGTGSVMCGLQRVNNSQACANSDILNGLLKTELAFQGFVVSDYGAVTTGIASALAGLDMAQPSSPFFAGQLVAAVANGSLPQSRLDDMATRILATWYKLSDQSEPGFGLPANLSLPHTLVNARDPASKETIFQAAVEGHVLVKNNGALPLKAPAFLSIFGYDAQTPPAVNYDPVSGFGLWSDGDYSVANLTDADVFNFFFNETYSSGPPSARAGTLISGGGSGAVTPPYISAPFDAISAQAYDDGTYLMWDFESQDPMVDGASTACLVFVNAFASEGYDRPGLTDPWSDQLVLNVASKCNNTIVSTHNAGIQLVDAWVDNPNITAVIFSHLPGQDSGRALVELLYGKQSFSGRLPYTVAKKATDYGSLLGPTVPDATSDYYTQSNFTEGVYIDYKSFIARNITPRYEFGFGLTYSNFSYTNPVASFYANVSLSSLPPNSTVGEGGLTSLWDTIASVSATITNTGSVEAAEVAQLYVGIPGAPPKQLRGYSKDLLAPNASCTVTFPLMRRDLSVWDTTQQQWVLPSGSIDIYIGKSVLDIQLQTSLPSR